MIYPNGPSNFGVEKKTRAVVLQTLASKKKNCFWFNAFFRFGSEHGEGKFKRLIICIASRLLAHVVTSAGFSWNSQLVTLKAVKQKL